MMTFSLMALLPLLFLTPTASILMSYSHFLMILMYLEALSLMSLLSMFFMISLNSSLEPMSLLMIITLGATGASLGLSCLVAMMRTYGNDQIKSLSPTKF